MAIICAGDGAVPRPIRTLVLRAQDRRALHLLAAASLRGRTYPPIKEQIAARAGIIYSSSSRFCDTAGPWQPNSPFLPVFGHSILEFSKFSEC